MKHKLSSQKDKGKTAVDQGQPQKESKDQDNYQQQFQEEPVEQIENSDQPQFPEEEEKAEHVSPLNQASEVQSQIKQESINDAIEEQGMSNQLDKFQNDEDLSLAQSEFVETAKLDIDSKIKHKKDKSKQKSKERLIDKSTSAKKDIKKQSKKNINGDPKSSTDVRSKINISQQQINQNESARKERAAQRAQNMKKIKEETLKRTKQLADQPRIKSKEPKKKLTAQQIDEKLKSIQLDKESRLKKQKQKEKQKQKQEMEQKKQKLSQSEIKLRRQAIEKEKKQILRKKEEKQKREEQKVREEYQEAKKKQEERKLKNKLIFEEKKKEKKENIQKPKPVEEVTLPEKKKLQTTYQQQVKLRKQNQRNLQKQIQLENKQKLKQLLQKPEKIKGQDKKMAFLQQREQMKKNELKQRRMEVKQDDLLVIKQLKQEINQNYNYNKEKQQQIQRADQHIQELTKKLKDKEKVYFQTTTSDHQSIDEEFNNASELTPIEKFVHCFPDARNSEEIFRLIDTNRDEVLSSEQIRQKLLEFKLQGFIIKQVENILDENSDGTVSKDEFVFYIDRQVTRQKEYKKILGIIQMKDPLDLQAKIIDMKAKMQFIDEKIDKHNKNKNNNTQQSKLSKLKAKAEKIQQERKKQAQNINSQPSPHLNINTTAHLSNEAIKLKNQKNIKAAFLQKIRTKVKDNLSEKTKLLASRVEENLRLEQQIYTLKNEIQQTELRYLSLKKIENNKKGYLLRQTQQQKELEQAHKKAKQYKIAITDPTKKTQQQAERDELKLLAAVLIIQRNYRKRKARGEFEKLKAQQK